MRAHAADPRFPGTYMLIGIADVSPAAADASGAPIGRKTGNPQFPGQYDRAGRLRDRNFERGIRGLRTPPITHMLAFRGDHGQGVMPARRMGLRLRKQLSQANTAGPGIASRLRGVRRVTR